jgi:hypothetical protein
VRADVARDEAAGGEDGHERGGHLARW